MRTMSAVAIVLLLAPLTAVAQATAVEVQNQEVIRRFYEEINRGDVKAAAAKFADDGQNIGRTVGPSGMEERLVDILATFPDWHTEILESVASGDIVVIRCRLSGTHRGTAKMPLNGMPPGVAPTGKRFEVMHMYWHKLRNGKIVERFASRDDLGMLRQLGLLPPVTPQ